MKKDFSPSDKGLIIKKYKFWTLHLCPNQYYLGRMRIVLNRKGIADLCDLSKQELTELWTIIKQVKRALKKCFQPDLFNYATLGNCVRQHHWHVIPRYKTKRMINGTLFQDKRWNKCPWPYSKKTRR